MRIYVASSWRNERQPAVVRALRDAGHEVYDFKNPPGGTGFGWRQVTGDEEDLKDPRRFRDRVLTHPRAVEGYTEDMTALRAADAVVLVLPCGRSAHLELGWATGAGKWTCVLLDDPISEPELMIRMNDAVATSLEEAVAWVTALGAERGGTKLRWSCTAPRRPYVYRGELERAARIVYAHNPGPYESLEDVRATILECANHCAAHVAKNPQSRHRAGRSGTGGVWVTLWHWSDEIEITIDPGILVHQGYRTATKEQIERDYQELDALTGEVLPEDRVRRDFSFGSERKGRAVAETEGMPARIEGTP